MTKCEPLKIYVLVCVCFVLSGIMHLWWVCAFLLVFTFTHVTELNLGGRPYTHSDQVWGGPPAWLQPITGSCQDGPLATPRWQQQPQTCTQTRKVKLSPLSLSHFSSVLFSHTDTHITLIHTYLPQKKADRYRMGRMVVRLTSLQFIVLFIYFYYFNTFRWCF